MTATSPSLLAPAAEEPGVPAPELSLAIDIAKRAIFTVPFFIVGGLLADGTTGAFSAGIGVALVLANFLGAAASLVWAARVNLAVLMGVALFGYVVRLGILFGAVLALRELGWVHIPSLGLTIVVMHLGLLLWELKYVSLSLAHPGIKPEPSTTRSPST